MACRLDHAVEIETINLAFPLKQSSGNMHRGSGVSVLLSTTRLVYAFGNEYAWGYMDFSGRYHSSSPAWVANVIRYGNHTA